MTKSILVVAAHPDDEVIGCGGVIARHADVGDQVQVLIVAEGATSRQQQRDRRRDSGGLDWHLVAGRDCRFGDCCAVSSFG